MATEPTLEQLSAYIDDELDTPARTELEAHLTTCSSCRARVDAMQHTVSAIRALPMETPPRAFTVPVQRQRSWSWAPAGWLGGAAAALVVVAVGISQLHNLGGSGASTASQNSGGLAAVAAPLVQPRLGAGAQDHAAYSAEKAAVSGQQTTVVQSGSVGPSLTLSTDGRSYSMNGLLSLRVTIQGLTRSEASTVRIALTRDGYAVRLAPPVREQSFPMAFDASYAIPDMHLPAPPDGTYSLQVTVEQASGSSLAAQLPVTITP